MEQNAILKKRIISAAILVPITIFVIIKGGFIFNLLLVSIALILMSEFFNILEKTNNLDLLSKYTPFVIAYCCVPIASFISLRYLANGIEVIIFICLIVWLSDISAYFTGKALGGPKLAPKISPNKTISGALGAVIISAIFALIAYFFTDKNISLYSFIVIAIFLSIFSQIGDLIESFFKRKFGIKDSGNIIPGHGGLFDRLDGLLLASVLGYIIFGIFNQNIF
jgi:phosphatidate cytidylyltransferase